MAALPEPKHSTVSLIYESYEREQKSGHRPHLGASVIGRKCSRHLWYTFRWAYHKPFPGVVLRKFDRGSLEEARWWADLRRIGIQVSDSNESGEQWSVRSIGGHFGGSIDGVGIGFPEAPKAWHVLEVKTHNSTSYRSLIKDGVRKSKPEHYAQMQVYMHLTGLERAVYLATNKDSDELYVERVEYDESVAEVLMKRAEAIIASPEPPIRISNDPSWHECKHCQHASICHGTDLPEVNCRTCAHSTPEPQGDARWSCAKVCGDPNISSIPLDFQRTGCSSHRYIPIFLERMGRQTDTRGDDVVYVDAVDMPFVNGEGEGALSSHELRALEDKSSAWFASTKKLELAAVGMPSEVVG